MFIELKWWSGRHIEYFKLRPKNFDLASGHIRVDFALHTRPHPTHHSQHVLIAHAISGGKALLSVRVIDHLNQPTAITNVQEDNATVIAAPMHPAAQGHRFAHFGRRNLATVVTSHVDFSLNLDSLDHRTTLFQRPTGKWSIQRPFFVYPASFSNSAPVELILRLFTGLYLMRAPSLRPIYPRRRSFSYQQSSFFPGWRFCRFHQRLPKNYLLMTCRRIRRC